MPLFKKSPKKSPKKAPKQEKGEKFTGLAFDKHPFRAEAGRRVKYIKREAAVVPAESNSNINNTSNDQNKGANESGWNPLAIGAVAAVAAFALPGVAASATAALGYGAVAYTATAITGHYRGIRESDNQVRMVETITEAEVEHHRIEAQERVITRLVDRGDFEAMRGYVGHNSTNYLETDVRGMIEYWSDSE